MSWISVFSALRGRLAWCHVLVLAGAWIAALCLFPAAASAQTYTYNDTTSTTITDNNCGGGFVSRTINVGTSYTIADVNLGVMLNHTYRSDLRITLTSPSGTTVNVMTNVGGAADNLNVLFDDEASANISTHTNNDTSGTPPVSSFQRTFIPTSALSAFDGQNASGNWVVTICDSVAQDTGTYLQASLIIAQVPTSYADLSMTKTVSNASPANGNSISYTLTVSNAASSPNSATGVTVLDVLPGGTSFVSATGTGSYVSGTGIWTVGTLAPGATATLTITVTVTATAGATVTNGAEVRTSSIADLDSTPNNGSTTEDDDAFATFTVSGSRVAGTPPTLSCPVGTTIFDWDAVNWTAGSTSNSYSQADIGTIQFSVTNPGSWLNNATYGGQSPARQNVVTGGFSPAQFSLFQLTDFNSISENAITTITLPTAVPGLQFRVFDVDYNAGQFSDRITVTGTFNGANVTPVLTNGVANWVAGNSAYGDAVSADNSSNGNVVVTFSSPVDTIVISYGNHSTAPSNPGQQAIALHDITFCRPVTTLTVTKISSVLADGVSGSNPKSIPGATVRYCITVQNNGSGTATNVVATDTLPANVTYVAGSMLSGTSCGSAATAEDDDNSGADETDPFGMSISGTTVSGRATTIAPSSNFAMVFHATVN